MRGTLLFVEVDGEGEVGGNDDGAEEAVQLKVCFFGVGGADVFGEVFESFAGGFDGVDELLAGDLFVGGEFGFFFEFADLGVQGRGFCCYLL